MTLIFGHLSFTNVRLFYHIRISLYFFCCFDSISHFITFILIFCIHKFIQQTYIHIRTFTHIYTHTQNMKNQSIIKYYFSQNIILEKEKSCDHINVMIQTRTHSSNRHTALISLIHLYKIFHKFLIKFTLKNYTLNSYKAPYISP